MDNTGFLSGQYHCLLFLHDLAVGYKRKKILEGINLKLYQGEAKGISGPNGIGKSTLFKTILGLLPIIEGEIAIFGRKLESVTDGNWVRTKIGYVPQNKGQARLPITVEDAVLLGRWGRTFSYFTRPSKKDRDFTRQVLADMGIFQLKDRDCRGLSGGEYQRVTIARALAREASLLLLDEPTTYLDSEARQELSDILNRLREEYKLSFLVVSHLKEELLTVADEVIPLKNERGTGF